MRDRTNCPNCGMPIVGAKCEYCGTQFYDMADISADDFCFLRMRLWGGKIYTVKARLINVDYTAFAPDTLPEIKLTLYLNEQIREDK